MALTLESYLGVNIVEDLLEAINVKLQADREIKDPKFEKFVEILEQKIAEGKVEVLLKEVTQELEKWCIENKLKPPKTRTLIAYQKDCGFRDGINRKRICR